MEKIKIIWRFQARFENAWCYNCS